MTVKEVSYERIFPLGAYINEKIRVDVSVSDGEDAKDCLAYARKLVYEFHKESNPGIDEMIGTVISDVHKEPERKLTQEEQKKAAIQQVILSITGTTSLKNTEMFKKLVDRENDPELTAAYNEMIEKNKDK